MKKVFAMLLLAGGCLTFGCNPKDDKESKDEKISSKEDKDESEAEGNDMGKAAAAYCDCLNNSFDGMNPKIKKMIIKAGNSDDAISTLQAEMMKIEDDQEKADIAEEVQKFAEVDKDPEVKSCVNKIKKKYDIDDEDKKVQKKLMAELEENNDCDLVYALMKIGMQEKKGNNTTDDE